MRRSGAFGLVAIVVLAVGAAFLIAQTATPTCRNYAGTARDSGYPCVVKHSSGAQEFIFSRSSSIEVPLATPIAIGLIILGGVGLWRYRGSPS